MDLKETELVGKQMHHILRWIYRIWGSARLKWVEWLNFHYCLKLWRKVALANVCTRVTKGETQIAVKRSLMEGCLALEFRNKSQIGGGSHDATVGSTTFFSVGFLPSSDLELNCVWSDRCELPGLCQTLTNISFIGALIMQRRAALYLWDAESSLH